MWAALALRVLGLERKDDSPVPPGPCPCDHPPLPLALPSPGCWMRRVHLPSSRLIVPSLGDSCSENSLGLVINQDETRVISCERQASPGRPAGSRARVHMLTPGTRPAPMALAHLAKAVWEAEVDTEVDRAASAL